MFELPRNKESESKKEKNKNVKTIVNVRALMESTQKSIQEAKRKFAKPSSYERRLLDDGTAKRNTKLNAFNTNTEVKDPYTGKRLTLTKSEAKAKYGKDWQKHLAEVDHIVPLDKRYEQTKNNPWLSNKDIKKSSNSSDNLENVSRAFNNAKRNRSNKEFVSDDEYLKKTGVDLNEVGKKQAIKNEIRAKKALQMQDLIDSVNNILETGNSAGFEGMKDAGISTMTITGILNIVSVIKGEKSAKEAIKDIASDTGKSAAVGYASSSILTVLSHTLSYSSSPLIQALLESNVPGYAVTAVMLMGDTVKKYVDGKLSTEQCLTEIQEKTTVLTGGISGGVAGQMLIPIPIVGAAVGSLVGSTLASIYYNKMSTLLKNNKIDTGTLVGASVGQTLISIPVVGAFAGVAVNSLIKGNIFNKQDIKLITEERKKAETLTKMYRNELKSYLVSYFKDYPNCFDEIFASIDELLESCNLLEERTI